MPLKTTLLTIAALQLLSGTPVAQDKPESLAIWPGYTLELPPNHCVRTNNGPDFHVFYFHDRQSPQRAILAGVYAGFAPDFGHDCVKPATRTWNANGLAFQSVRSSDGCAEFLVHDTTSPQRGYLHIWFGPGATEHAQMAEALIASIRPAPMPLKDVTEPPACQ